MDEIHAVDRRELAQIGADHEGFHCQGRPVILVVAGLPALVARLLAEAPAAFLLPADRIVLHNVTVPDVERSFARTFSHGGFDLPAPLLRQAAEATGGYPFMVQLVGYHLWRETADAAELTPAATAKAIGRARERLSLIDLT
ncbi:hypothetical protein [Arthrobacter sp. CP30]